MVCEKLLKEAEGTGSSYLSRIFGNGPELIVLPIYSALPEEYVIGQIFSPTPQGKRKVEFE